MATTKKPAAKKPAVKKAAAPAKNLAAKKASKPAVKRTPNAGFMKAMTPNDRLAVVVGAMPIGLIKTFADSDACLNGSAREIKYYRKGKLVGKASPTTGIKLLDK